MDKEQKNIDTIKPDNYQVSPQTDGVNLIENECDLQKVLKPEILDL